MRSRPAKNTTRGLLFIGSLFAVVLLLPHVSASTAPLTGNDNTWISETSSCPGWGEQTEIAPSSTIESYTFGSSNQLLPNQWGWQDNGATDSTYNYDFYQFGQTAINVGTLRTNVGVQILGQDGSSYMGGNEYANTTWYIGTSGTHAYSTLLLGTGNYVADAVGASWLIYDSSSNLVLSTYYDWPQNYIDPNNDNVYSLWNPVQNFQNDFVGPAGTSTLTDFFSGAGQFTYSGGTSIDDNNGCNQITTGENSNMVYSSISCGSTQCTQNFDASSGYEGHNSPGGNFMVQFANGWGTSTAGVNKSDLLVAIEAALSGSVTFSTPQDSLGNSWTQDGGGTYCSASECVAIWHAVAKSSGADTVTFYSSGYTGYTYGFIREFVGYTGSVDTYKQNYGQSGTPSVASFNPTSGDLVIAAAADSNSGWSSGQYYYMIGSNTGWNAATEFSPGWQSGSTTASWSGPSSGSWAELVVAYSPP